MADASAKVFKSKTELSRDELADLFQALADRASEGDLTLDSGVQQVPMELPDGCLVEIEVNDVTGPGGIERELELEISWQIDETGAPIAGQTPKRGFTIS